ncbi:MAG: hypothetical protein ACRDQ4_15145 [Pseudonocardiaceae bacterium]
MGDEGDVVCGLRGPLSANRPPIPIATSAFGVFAEEKFLGRKEGQTMRITGIFRLGQDGYERGGDWGGWGWGGWDNGWGSWGDWGHRWGDWGHRWGGWGNGPVISLHLDL